MLKVMRDSTKSLRPILWLVLASFVLGFVVVMQGGLGSTSMLGGQDVVAEVGDRRITLAQLNEQLQRQDQQLRQMLGQAYQASQFLDAEATLSGLIDRAVLLEEAERIGLRATPEQVAAEIRATPAFQGPDGRFDREGYIQYVRSRGMRPKDFEKLFAEEILVREMTDLMRNGVLLTDAELREEWARETETAAIEHALWPLDEYLPRVSATEDELRARHAADPSRYDAGPARRVQWVSFSRDAIRAGLENEEEMRAFYEKNVADIYTMGPDQRRASTILVEVPPGADEGTRAAARARAEELATRARAAGADFAALATEASEDEGTREAGGDLGPFYKGVQDPAVDAAVFAAAEGDVLGPIETARGYEVLRVTKGEGTKARPFEEVRTQVAQGLYARDAADKVTSALTRFQEARADGKSFADAAGAAGLTATGPAWVTRDGSVEGGGEEPLVAAVAFESEVGTTSDPMPDEGGQLVVDVLEARESSPRDFEAAREDVERDVEEEKARELARADAEPARARAAGGTAFAEAVAPRTVETTEPFRRNGMIAGLGRAPDLAAKAFETPEGSVGPLADVPGGVVVFRVTAREGFDEEKFVAGRADFESRLRQQRFSALHRDGLAHLRDAYGDEIVTYPDLLPTFGTAQGG